MYNPTNVSNSALEAVLEKYAMTVNLGNKNVTPSQTMLTTIAEMTQIPSITAKIVLPSDVDITPTAEP